MRQNVIITITSFIITSHLTMIIAPLSVSQTYANWNGTSHTGLSWLARCKL